MSTMFPLTIKGANENPNKELLRSDLIVFKPIVAFQTYATFSMIDAQTGTDKANQTDVEFRRIRFGASGAPYKRLKYNFQLHFDRLGESVYSFAKGNYGGVKVWNAYLSYQLLNQNALLNLHLGYFWAATSREYNTSPWAIGSFDKVRATWYLRHFMSGKGNGIESGVGLGGLKNFDHWGMNYRIGTYETDAYSSISFSNRLYTARVAFSIGELEQKKYKYMLSGNQWGKRNGITLGFGGSTQKNGMLDSNSSLFFKKSLTYGADILFDYKGFRFDAEYFLLKREVQNSESFHGSEWHIRAGYLIPVKGKLIEPSITYDYYEGNGNRLVYKYIGDDCTLDIGVNYYLNKDKLKLSAHYMMQNGTVNSNTGDLLGMSCIYRL